MKRLIVAVCSIALVLALAAVALAVNPKKGATYSGSKTGAVEHKISLKVASNGKSAIVNLYCSGHHVSVMKNVVIAKGKFAGRKTLGSTLVWKIKGSFTSSTTAKATATLSSICDGGRAILTLTRATT
jgi:hypothetical protein